MLHPNAKALIIAADSWARVKALPARKRQVHHPEEAPSSDFTRQSLQIRSKFCRGRACKQAWDPARAEHRCRTKALVRTKADTLGIPLGPNPRQGADKDQHRHARESTRASYGCNNAQAPARTKAARRLPARAPARREHGCHARKKQRQAKPRSGSCSGSRSGLTRKGVSCGSHVQLAHARPSCASFGRVSQGSLHHACQPASLLR